MAGFWSFYLVLLLKLSSYYVIAESDDDENDLEPKHETRDFVFWPNATIPFYIDPEHFDSEQSLSIMTSLSLFAYKTCLKFTPVLARPNSNEHVMVFENPRGFRQCTINTDGHSIDEPHLITLGYECLKTPNIEMMVMNALGYPFEHNRAIRNLYIDVQQENIEPGNMELFTLESKLPEELRVLPYDVNSVLHFDERAFSKNGHRTIIFKDHKTKQCRDGLSDLDVRKITIVYGPECLKRDRQEKIEICQNYPGVARRKREALPEIIVDATENLRVNRDITPPPNIVNKGKKDKNKLSEDNTELTVHIKQLGIEKEVQSIVDQVDKVISLALKNARIKYCNESKNILRTEENIKKGFDVMGIVKTVSDYSQNMIENAIGNLTVFCTASESLEKYQRQRAPCPFFEKSRCVAHTAYKSTMPGAVKVSTQHRPVYRPSTKNDGSLMFNKHVYESLLRARADNDTVTNDTIASRRKREILRVEEVQVEKRKRDVGIGGVTTPLAVNEDTGTTPVTETVTIPKTTDSLVTGKVAESRATDTRRFR